MRWATPKKYEKTGLSDNQAGFLHQKIKIRRVNARVMSSIPMLARWSSARPRRRRRALYRGWGGRGEASGTQRSEERRVGKEC